MKLEVIRGTHMRSYNVAAKTHEVYAPTDEELREHIRNGKAVSFNCSFPYSRERGRQLCGDLPHDVWYSERNGDAITLIVPKGTPKEDLPDAASGYRILEWIPPEGDFSY